jgi:uncharacterized protein YjbI with pentapeptide repeats
MSDDKESQKPEIRSKEWSEIIAEQFSVVAWIKGIKIYLSIIGVLGLGVYLAVYEFICGTIGIICFVIAYSLDANKSKEIDVNVDSENTNDDDTTAIDEEIKLKETDYALLKENLELKKRLETETKGSSGGAWAGTIGALILIIAWGYVLFISLFSILDIETHPASLATVIAAIIGFTAPSLIVPVPLTVLILWKKDFFFPNTNAKMHARSMIRLAYCFCYFLIFFTILSTFFYGWSAPQITLIDVMFMVTFFLASSFISVLPKYTPTKEDSKDAEFITFFIILTIITYTFFMMLSVLSVTDNDLTVLPIILFCTLILLILSYNFILELVKKYFLNGQNNVDDSYDFYQKEKNTGSLLYIGLISIYLFAVVPNFIIALLGSLFVISIVKTRITGLSDWKTPLGNLTKYEFSLFTFNIVLVLAFVYAIHDDIEFSRSEDEPLANSCESLKTGDGLVTSRTSYYSYIDNCDLSYSYLANENMRGISIQDTSFEYAILRNADLSRAELRGDVDFTNADLSAADLSRADFSGEVNFTNANLEQANLGNTVCGRWESCNNLTFANANLRNAIFENAYLGNVNFQGADLRGAYIANANIFRYAVFDENTIVDKDALAGMSLDNSDLSHFNLSGYDLTGTSLKGVNLSGRDFSGYNFTGTNFNGANLSGVNLSGSTLTGVSGFDLQGCPSSMPDNWICLTNNLIGPETSFRGLNFNNGDLSNRHLSNSNFSSANLRSTNFSNANLTNSYFSYRNFDEINDMIMWYGDNPDNVTDYFKHIDFEGDFDDYLVKIKTESAADLSNTNLSGANLSYVNFAYANLTNADLSGADLTGTIWRYTICPDGTNTEESGSCESN